MSRISLDTFINKSVGKALDVPWGYGGECVSMVQRYINECHGAPLKRRGNAVTYGNSLVKEGLAKVVTKPQYGDIIVWGKPLGYIKGKYYGHVAIYIDNKVIFDQNNSTVRPTRSSQVRPAIKARPIQYIRMNTALVEDKPKYQEEVYAFTSTVDLINIRADYSTKAKITGTLKKGETFNYIGKIEANGHVWVTDGAEWVAVRTIKNGIRGTLWGTLHPQKQAITPKPQPKPPFKPKEKWLRIPTTIKTYSFYKPTQANKTVANRWGELKPYNFRHQAKYLEYKVIKESGNFKTLQLNGHKRNPLIDIYTGKGTEHAWEIFYK